MSAITRDASQHRLSSSGVFALIIINNNSKAKLQRLPLKTPAGSKQNNGARFIRSCLFTYFWSNAAVNAGEWGNNIRKFIIYSLFALKILCLPRLPSGQHPRSPV